MYWLRHPLALSALSVPPEENLLAVGYTFNKATHFLLLYIDGGTGLVKNKK